MALTAIHPGEHLAEELEALDMSAAELARKINVPTNRITQILNGTRAITGDTALRLAHFFGTSAQFWLNLQSLYELRLAHGKVGKSIKALPTLKRRELAHALRVNATNSENDGPRPENWQAPRPYFQSASYALRLRVFLALGTGEDRNSLLGSQEVGVTMYLSARSAVESACHGCRSEARADH